MRCIEREYQYEMNKKPLILRIEFASTGTLIRPVLLNERKNLADPELWMWFGEKLFLLEKGARTSLELETGVMNGGVNTYKSVQLIHYTATQTTYTHTDISTQTHSHHN